MIDAVSATEITVRYSQQWINRPHFPIHRFIVDAQLPGTVADRFVATHYPLLSAIQANLKVYSSSQVEVEPQNFINCLFMPKCAGVCGYLELIILVFLKNLAFDFPMYMPHNLELFE